MGWISKTDRAKKAHRPSLKDWTCDHLYTTFPPYQQEILNLSQDKDISHSYEACLPFGKTPQQSYHCYHETEEKPRSTVRSVIIPRRMDAKKVSPSTFHSEYEARGIPTVMTNVPQGYDVPLPPPSNKNHPNTAALSSSMRSNPNEWKALTEWDWEELEKSPLRERLFKCGEDDDGRSVKM